jgi:hypothetical protein
MRGDGYWWFDKDSPFYVCPQHAGTGGYESCCNCGGWEEGDPNYGRECTEAGTRWQNGNNGLLGMWMWQPSTITPGLHTSVPQSIPPGIAWAARRSSFLRTGRRSGVLLPAGASPVTGGNGRE